MLSSKFYYMVAGFDIGWALVLARLHDPMAFGFLGCAVLLSFIGDQRKVEENKPKGDNNNG